MTASKIIELLKQVDPNAEIVFLHKVRNLNYPVYRKFVGLKPIKIKTNSWGCLVDENIGIKKKGETITDAFEFD